MFSYKNLAHFYQMETAGVATNHVTPDQGDECAHGEQEEEQEKQE